MDWTFVVSQVVIVITAIVSAIIAGIITVRYQKSDSLGVSQRTKDRFTAVILAILSLLGVAAPLSGAIWIAYRIYFSIVKWPDVVATRADVLVVAVFVFYFHVNLVLGTYNSANLIKTYRKAQRAKIQREIDAGYRAEMAPLDDAFKKLRETLDKTKEIKPLPPDEKS